MKFLAPPPPAPKCSTFPWHVRTLLWGEWFRNITVWREAELNTMGCRRTVMILFGGATGVLNLVSYCPWNQLREIAPNFFCCCLRPLSNLGVRERGRQYKEDSEREGQRLNPGVVVVLRHGTPPPSHFIPLFLRELPSVVSQKAQYTSGVVLVSLFSTLFLFHDSLVFLFSCNVTIYLSPFLCPNKK